MDCFHFLAVMNSAAVNTCAVVSEYLFSFLLGIYLAMEALYVSSPNLFGTRDGFCGRQFFHGPRVGRGMVSG